MRRRQAIAAGALGLALLLGACGGGEETSSPAPPSAAAADEGPRVLPLEVSGGGSAQFHVKGGDNSIQDYGREAGRGELRRAARLLHGYYAALAREGWARACERLDRGEKARVAGIAVASPKIEGDSCAAALAALFGGVSAAEGREATAVDAVSLRREGTQGFLIYRGAGRKPYFASLKSEGGGWAVHGLSPTPLP